MPSRVVHIGDGIAWLRTAKVEPGRAIVTSIPDVSEMPHLSVPAWCALATEIAALACRAVTPESVVVLYQTDIKADGRTIDKAHLVHKGAEQAGAHCLWHKIVCRTAPDNITFGRPSFGHWLAFSRAQRVAAGASTADVLSDTGAMTWARAMPMRVATETCRFLKQHTQCRTVVDPFCGHGTILAVANEYGLDAVGIELSAKRARKARRLTTRDGVPDTGDHGPRDDDASS